ILVEFFRKYEGNSVDENLSVNDVFILIFTEAFHTESSVFGNEIFNGYIPDYRSAFFACLVCSLNIYFATYTQNKPIIKQFFLSCDIKLSTVLRSISLIIGITIQPKIEF